MSDRKYKAELMAEWAKQKSKHGATDDDWNDFVDDWQESIGDPFEEPGPEVDRILLERGLNEMEVGDGDRMYVKLLDSAGAEIWHGEVACCRVEVLEPRRKRGDHG